MKKTKLLNLYDTIIGIIILSTLGAMTTIIYVVRPELLTLRYFICGAFVAILGLMLIFEGKTNV